MSMSLLGPDLGTVVIVFTSFIKHGGTGTALPDGNGRTLVTTTAPRDRSNKARVCSPLYVV
jgi:hypothetical protein